MISGTLGELIPNKLVTYRALQGSLATLLFTRRLNLSTGYSTAKGGKLFGFVRDENTTSLNLSYQAFSKITIGVGYNKVDSTLDYFDVSEPNVNIQFATIKF